MRRIVLIVIGVICFTLTSSVGYFWYTDDRIPTLTINSKAELQEFMYHMFKVPEVNAQNLDYSIAEINQYLGEVEAIGVLNGLLTSDGARNYSVYTPVQAITEPGEANEMPSESAVVNYVQSQPTGEANLAANAGAGAGNVFRDKTGVVLNFRTIRAGANIVINQTADEIEISTSAGVGEANTGANIGTGEGALYQGKTGTVLNFKRLQAGANVSITDTGNEVIINSTGGGGTGTVTGPPSSTNSAIPRWDGVAGDAIKDSGIIIDDSNNMTGVNQIIMNASVNPRMPIKDADAPGANKVVAYYAGEYVSGVDGSEYGELRDEVVSNGTVELVRKTDGYGVYDEYRGITNGHSRGSGFILTAGEAISKFDIVYIDPLSVNPLKLANATAGQTTFPSVGIAMNAAAIGEPVRVLQRGAVVNTGWTLGTTAPSFIYLNKTNGTFTQNVGAWGTGDCFQIVGRAINATTAMFDFTNSYSLGS